MLARSRAPRSIHRPGPDRAGQSGDSGKRAAGRAGDPAAGAARPGLAGAGRVTAPGSHRNAHRAADATQPPIVVEPATPAVEPGRTVSARVNSAAGTITATAADPAIATVTVDQTQRTILITGVAVGSTTVTVGDSRGVTRDVAVRVAYAAGTIADALQLRVTGDPATVTFLRDAAITAAEAAATLRTGARIYVPPESVAVHAALPTDDRTTIDVPVQISATPTSR